jgi:hypothetical protein
MENSGMPGQNSTLVRTCRFLAVSRILLGCALSLQAVVDNTVPS